jgi:hypothetical protein
MIRSRRGSVPWRPVLLTLTLLAVLGGVAATVWANASPFEVRGDPMSRDAGAPPPTTALREAQQQAAQQAAQPAAQQAQQQAPRRAAAGQAQLGCERCHGELELLRQQAGSLARAQQVLVPEHVVAASAHGAMNCAECHSGYTSYPHEERITSTQSCASCHAPADSLWRLSTHAGADDAVTCVQCHGSHDIRPAEVLSSRHGAATANAPCVTCHEAARLERHSPHADSVSCASCHAPHATRPVDDPDSWLSPQHQLQTCGACHEAAEAAFRNDIHGNAELRAQHLAGRAPAADIVVCTSCHIGHAMIATDDPRFAVVSVERCSTCHEDATRTFFKSYHGRATALGSRVSASCADCHGSHGIFPDTFPASTVAQANLVETCRACHENARPAFVLYDAHPDPFNRARNPWIFFSFVMMNVMLVGVLAVFGAHTLLWWWRLWLDKRRGIIHGIGVHHHPQGHQTRPGEGGAS